MCQYTTDENELNTLNELCSPQATGKYNDFITKNYITLFELLSTFPSCLPPFTLLLEHLPKLQPRRYSVSSSPNGTELKFIYSLEELPNGYEGICTSWLHQRVRLHENEPVTIPIYLRKINDFHLPDDASTNIIMIAAGTGIAPMLSFLRSRNETSGKVWLFYGCRYSNRDFLHRDEIEAFVKSGRVKLTTAFSRESSCRIQDKIRERAREFVDFLGDDTVVFVCVNNKMSRSVHETVRDCIREGKSCGAEEANVIMDDLKKKRRYLEDVWN